MDYKQNIIKIKNKYKNINNENESKYNHKIGVLNMLHDIIINNYKYKKEIEKKSNFNQLIEIVYNTYTNYNSNFYNITNMMNIYNIYFKIDNKNKLLIERLDEKDIIIKEQADLINEKDNIIQNNENELKEKNDIIKKNEEKIEEYDDKIKNKEEQIESKDITSKLHFYNLLFLF